MLLQPFSITFTDFEVDLPHSQIHLKRKQRVCKTLYYPFLISANQRPHERNSFLCYIVKKYKSKPSAKPVVLIMFEKQGSTNVG